MYRIRRLAIVALASLAPAFVACNDDAPTAVVAAPRIEVDAAAQIAASVRNDSHILALWHVSNIGAIAAGALAQQRAIDAGVLAFAAQMVSEYRAIDLKGAALSWEIQVAPTLPDSSLLRLQQAESVQLGSLAIGSAFDRLYVAQQVVAHQRTLAIVDSSITRAQNVALRTMLQDQFRPTVAAHLRSALELQAVVGKP
jgi:predicted outer membrane protein